MVMALRLVSPILDFLAWLAAWGLCYILLGPLVLIASPSSGDNFGVWVIAAGIALAVASLLLAITEMVKGTSFGRYATGLVVVDPAGSPVPRDRLMVRALAKYIALGAALAAGALMVAVIQPRQEIVMALAPLSITLVANVACVVLRRDHRSFLDLMSGTRASAKTRA